MTQFKPIILAVALVTPFTGFADRSTSELSKQTTLAILENFSGLPPPIGDPIPEQEYLALRRPITFALTKGRIFEGTFNRIHDGRVFFRMVQGGGEVVLSFPTEEVEEVIFPGGEIVSSTIEKIEDGELGEALPYLESIIGSQYALFPLVAPEDLSLFRNLPMAALVVDNPAQAIAYVRALRPFLTLPEDQKALRNIELLSYYRLDLVEEAKSLAKDWIEEEDPFGDSALGFYVLSSILFEEADYEGALFAALKPIVYSGSLAKSYLAPCYSLAIASSHLIDDPIERDKLFKEMTDRGIAWMALPVFDIADEGLSDLTLLNGEGQPIPIFNENSPEENFLDSPGLVPGQSNSLDPSGILPL